MKLIYAIKNGLEWMKNAINRNKTKEYTRHMIKKYDKTLRRLSYE